MSHSIELNDLVELLASLGDRDGAFSTAIPNLHFIRSSKPETPRMTTERAVFCLVAQGSQRLLLKEGECLLDPTTYLVIGLPLPMVGEIVKASKHKPCFGVYLDLDLEELDTLIAEDGLYVQEAVKPQKGIFEGKVQSSLLDAVYNLVALLKQPEHMLFEAPALRLKLIRQLLSLEESQFLLRPISPRSPARRVEKAVEWMRKRAHHCVRVEDLAKIAKMSQSGTFAWFKGVTTMTPLQFQKQLRLLEARRMLVTERVDALSVSQRVGYESVSQFSREYRRLFGNPPLRDARQLGAFRNPR